MADGGYGDLIAAGGGVLGDIFAGVDRSLQQSMLRQALDEFGNIDLPKLEQIVAETLGPSQLAGVHTDPEYIADQKASLAELRRIAQTGGMTLTDKADQNEAMGASARQARAGQARIREDMAFRGGGGGGQELAMNLQNQQASTQRTHDTGLRTAAEAQRRRLDAIIKGGQLAGDVRQQDYGEKARAAEAQDMINRLSWDARNKARYYNAGLPQQNFDNRLRKASGKAGQLNVMAGNAGESAQRTANTWTNLGQAGAEAADAYQRPKKEEEDRLNPNGTMTPGGW